MITRRSVLIDIICQKVGIDRRIKPGSHYLSRRELIVLNGWVDAAAALLEKKKHHVKE